MKAEVKKVFKTPGKLDTLQNKKTRNNKADDLFALF